MLPSSRPAGQAPENPLAVAGLQGGAGVCGGALSLRPRHLGTFLGGLLDGCRRNSAVTSCLPARAQHAQF